MNFALNQRMMYDNRFGVNHSLLKAIKQGGLL